VPGNPLRAEDFFGAWQLVRIRTTAENGDELENSLFGASPQGLIVYDPSGWMSVQIQPDAQGPEIGARRVSYYAYCGRWTFDAATQTVTHAIEWATHHRARGERLERTVVGAGNEIALSTGPQPEAAGARNHLTWRRLASP
jgi:hypothetical protein